jgi:hypothetical protein
MELPALKSVPTISHQKSRRPNAIGGRYILTCMETLNQFERYCRHGFGTCNELWEAARHLQNLHRSQIA